MKTPGKYCKRNSWVLFSFQYAILTNIQMKWLAIGDVSKYKIMSSNNSLVRNSGARLHLPYTFIHIITNLCIQVLLVNNI